MLVSKGQEDGAKLCPHCGRLLEITEFGVTKRRLANGTYIAKHQSWCKDCYRRYANKPFHDSLEIGQIADAIGESRHVTGFILSDAIRRLWREKRLRTIWLAKQRGLVDQSFRVDPLEPWYAAQKVLRRQDGKG